MEKETVNCAICDKDNTFGICTSKSLHSEDSFDIVRCKECGLVYVNPRQDWKSKKIILENMNVVNIFQEKSDRDTNIYAFSLDFIERFKRPSNILDIGCSTGRLLKEAKKRGWEAYGIELNKSCADYCVKKESIKVFQGEAYETDFPHNFFDVVTMIHSIEHLYNLTPDIKKISSMLKPGGVFFIMTPNFNDYLIRAFKKLRLVPSNMDAIDPTGHPYMFTIHSLSNLLNSNGFKVKYASASISGSFLFKKSKLVYLIVKPFLKLISFMNIGSTLTVLAEKI